MADKGTITHKKTDSGAKAENNQKVCWYILCTNNEEKLQEFLDRQNSVVETYLPIRHTGIIKEGVLKRQLIVRRYLFVKSSYSSLLKCLRGQWFLEYNTLNGNRLSFTVSDAELDQFRCICDEGLSVEYLRKPYCDFISNDRVRILNGPLKGKEGFVTRVHKDHKLVFHVGNVAFAIGNLNKYRYIVIPNDSEKDPQNEDERTRTARLVDFFKADIAENTHLSYGDSAAFLIELIDGLHKYASSKIPFQQLERKCSKVIAQLQTKEKSGKVLIEGETTKLKRTVQKQNYLIHLQKDENSEAAQSLIMWIAYIYSKAEHPVLERIIPSTPIRPFLTPTYSKPTKRDDKHITKSNCDNFTEFAFTTMVQEGIYNRENDKIRMTGRPYTAHVILHQKNGTITLMANWDSFYKDIANDIKEDAELYRAKLEKKGCKVFSSALFDNNRPIRFLHSNNLGIYGIGTQLEDSVSSEEIESVLNEIVEQGKQIIKEIRSAQGMHREQIAIGAVWIRK